MKPLIDGDILLWELGSIGDIEGPKTWDFMEELVDGRIGDICDAVGATVPPCIFLTEGRNFRYDIAVTKPYKGNRQEKEKPYHFRNIFVYLQNQYECRVLRGIEADDGMAIAQVRGIRKPGSLPTVICSRDKDLRQVPGLYYSWECGAQREVGPIYIEEHPDPGRLEFNGKKLSGTGDLWFWAQLLTGDVVDNIPGCPGIGPKKAYEILTAGDGKSPWHKVRDTYYSKNLTDDYILEQGRLLWIVREFDEIGNPVMWELPE